MNFISFIKSWVVVGLAYSVLSVPLPGELKAEMDRHREIRWVEVARQAIVERLRILEKMDELLAKSEFSEKDALRHGRLVSRKAWGAK